MSSAPEKFTVEAFRRVLDGPDGKIIKDMALACEIIWKEKMVVAREDQIPRYQGMILGVRTLLDFAKEPTTARERKTGGYGA